MHICNHYITKVPLGNHLNTYPLSYLSKYMIYQKIIYIYTRIVSR